MVRNAGGRERDLDPETSESPAAAPSTGFPRLSAGAFAAFPRPGGSWAAAVVVVVVVDGR